MSHELTIRENGIVEAAFAVQESAGLDLPWHKLGTMLPGPMTSVEAITAAHMDWLVEQRPMGLHVDHGPQASERYTWQEVPGKLANVRSDNGLYLGDVSKSYKIVQNHEAFRFLDSLVDEGSLEYVSAFSMYEGRKICLVATLPQVDTLIEADPTLRYLMFSSTHDGSGAIKFGATSVRIVCANTHALALKKNGQTIRELSVSHTGDIMDKLERAKQIIGLANTRFDERAQQAAQLAERRLTGQEWQAFLDLICPRLDPMDPDHTERRAAAIDATRTGIEQAYQNERQSVGGIASTAWAAYNAVSEYVDHLPRRGATRARRAEARFNVQLYGTGADAKDRAWDTVLKIAGIDSQAG
jgi:phage/plasmid-like protein (TIGR03299 family)